MPGDDFMRPRLVNASHDALRAAERVHPDAWTASEQHGLLRAAEPTEAATLLFTAAHFATITPKDPKSAELRRAADQLAEGRTIVGSASPARPCPGLSDGPDMEGEGT